MSYMVIPLANTPNSEQSFKLSLKNDTVNIHILLKLRYLDQYGFWLADIYDNTTGEALVCAVPLICGTNILGQYKHLDIGEAYVAATTDTNLQHPDNTSLGTTFVLVWGDST